MNDGKGVVLNKRWVIAGAKKRRELHEHETAEEKEGVGERGKTAKKKKNHVQRGKERERAKTLHWERYLTFEQRCRHVIRLENFTVPVPVQNNLQNFNNNTVQPTRKESIGTQIHEPTQKDI